MMQRPQFGLTIHKASYHKLPVSKVETGWLELSFDNSIRSLHPLLILDEWVRHPANDRLEITLKRDATNNPTELYTTYTDLNNEKTIQKIAPDRLRKLLDYITQVPDLAKHQRQMETLLKNKRDTDEQALSHVSIADNSSGTSELNVISSQIKNYRPILPDKTPLNYWHDLLQVIALFQSALLPR